MKTKIAVVGCGRISANHFSSIAELPGHYQLVGACDIESNARTQISEKYNIESFTSLNEMLVRVKPDLVSICTPSGLHAEQGIAAAKAGCHVITEKPMATRYEDAVELVRTCHQTERKLFVVKQNRLNSTMQALKQAVERGRFGRIYNIASNVFWTRPQSYYDQAKWRGTWALDGGAFMNQASHYVDLLSWLAGPIESITSFNATLARKIEAEDCGVMALKFRNGVLATLNVSMLTYPKNFEGSITLIGEKGLVKIGGVALNKVEAWDFEDKDPSDLDVLNASYETNSVYGFGHLAFYREVAKAIDGLPNQATTGEEGLVSLAALIAGYRSAKNGGKPVGFPLDM
jgi:UDP-N-acetyl-2-amino-2-deoxyglucuronate dehydrogenase